MKFRISLAVCLLTFTFAAFAQHDHHGQAQQPAMDAKMMEAMMKAAMPGAEHKMLGGMAGTWNAKVTSWMVPGAPPSTMEGVSENKMIMDRYMEQRFSGNFQGMPFEGIGYTGYDNVKKQYWGTWMDNMSTGMMMTTGGPNADGTWTFTGTMPDPMTGKDAKVEEKLKMIDADHHTLEMWTPGPDGKMFKMMEITYSRKK